MKLIWNVADYICAAHQVWFTVAVVLSTCSCRTAVLDLHFCSIPSHRVQTCRVHDFMYCFYLVRVFARCIFLIHHWFLYYCHFFRLQHLVFVLLSVLCFVLASFFFGSLLLMSFGANMYILAHNFVVADLPCVCYIFDSIRPAVSFLPTCPRLMPCWDEPSSSSRPSKCTCPLVDGLDMVQSLMPTIPCPS